MDARSRQQLSQQGYSPQDAEAIVRRAVELQQQSESVAAPITHSTLEASAEAVGVRPEFVQRAAEELHSRQQSAARQALVHRRSRSQMVLMVTAALIAALIAGLLSVRVVVHRESVEPAATVEPQGAPAPAPPLRDVPGRR
jgi:hypothetical protein